ncbi:MAG: ABC transporter ATP-binding protein/permease [Defluviitaleaceae bacterium]|nr:ABC transporter ATP-binding protein/permease [Defluviitaleaceae bacterium]
MSKVFEFMKPYKFFIICSFALLVVDAACALILPNFMADIVNDGVIAGNISVIWRNGFFMVLITFLGAAAALTSSFFAAKTATGTANDLRAAVFKKVLRFSSAEMNKFSTSSLITRTTNDITQIQSTLMASIRLLIYSPILGIGGIIRALNRDVSMSWIVALATLVMMGIMAVMFTIALPKFKQIQDLIDRLNLVARENLNGILIVRAFSTQKFEKKRFAKANKDLADTNLFVDQIFALFVPSIMLILNVTTAVIVWVGARQASAFRIDIGDIFAFLQYGVLIIVSFLMLSMMFFLLPRAVVSAGRIKEVLETESSLQYNNSPVSLPEDFKGSVEFKNVTFRYPDALDSDDDVLIDLNFTAKPGETTAIIGATGSGKTTIFKLILRFYDVTGGGIYLDGIDVRDVHKEKLHDKIGYVPQKALLFTGDIRSNLIYADKEATEERIKEAVEISQSASFIAEKPDGFESNVAQGGSNFSGGQRQRLSIARALVKNSPIYLFDDSFSALDLKTDALLRTALKSKKSKSTMIIIAQRVSSIMDADQIVVLDHGKVVGLGKHFELMNSCEVYREIAASQLSEEGVKKS